MSTTKQSLALFWRYTKRYPLLFWTGTIGAVFGIIFQSIIPPFIVSRAFTKLQDLYATNSALNFADFKGFILAYLITMVIALIVWRLQAFSVWQYQIRAIRDIANDIFNHLQRQSERFHANRFGGALVSQTNKFFSAYERFMDEFTWSIVSGLTMLIASLAILFAITPLYAAILFASLVIYFVIMTWRIKAQFPFNRREAENETKRTAALADAITNISNIRAFAREDNESARFKGKVHNLFLASQRLSYEAFKNDSISHGITNILRVLAILFGIYAVTNYGASASVLYLVISYTIGIIDNLWQYARIVRNINRSFGDAAEMTEILAIQPEIQDAPHANDPVLRRGEVVFDKVVFSYPENKNEPLFNNLSLKIKPGEKIGLVGQSGGGKTTISKLLLRFMDINSGSIRIDGHDIVKMTQKNLRNHIAYVAQEPMLFHRSLKENIGYGNAEADMATIEGVAKLAHAHDFIIQLPKGYDTMVGERGVKLSGGQRQRVAIARAMLKNSPILILDEATSALDSESEALIQDALWKLMEGRTAIVIAHRLSTIQKMDRILVLDKGTIVEEGSHKELIQKNGIYAGLWRRQSGGFLND